VVKRDKRIDAMRRSPQQVRHSELDVVLKDAGFAVRQRGSSHKINSYGRYQISVPQHGRFVKEVYVRQALRLLDQIAQEEQQ
jgi:hypothetical protein